MQKILGLVRKVCEGYNMIESGDKIAIGVSGGKDSVVLLMALSLMRKFYPVNYQVVAITLDPCFGGISTDYSQITDLCTKLDVEYKIIPTQIGEIIFDVRKEENPCSLCARMRRGALHDAAKELGCNKIALGHHGDDALETFTMNLFTEGRIGCFSPVTYLSRKDITMIRPMILAEEYMIKSAVKRNGLPVVKSKCPADGYTNRQRVKDLLWELEQKDKGLRNRMFGALQRSGIDGWKQLK